MPRIVDYHAADDPRDIVHQIVQALVEGEVVGLPTETGYVTAAHALQPEAGSRLAKVRERLGCPRSLLALKHPQEALDYMPQMGELGRKLTRRFWPGPVTMWFTESSAGGLAGSLPPGTQQELGTADGLAFRVPGHDLTWNVLRLLPAPLLATGEIPGPKTRFPTAVELAHSAGDALGIIVDAGPGRYDQPTSLVRVDRDRWEVLHEGVAPTRTLDRLAGNMYLFVCTGNTCRSPMAEGLFRKLLADRLKCPEDELVDRGYMVASAGVAAGLGSPPSPEAVELLRDRGVDLRGHESQPVTPQLLSRADQIFTMTRSHREMLLREFPEAAPRVKLLARDGTDVIDPIGAGMEEYRRCADQIEEYLQGILAELPVPETKKPL
jgi:protein-tyrosine-phosphatase/tRNA A37 threonylcarbamoyladenosine synthetase subunit TsaC/SUA5/YrdC